LENTIRGAEETVARSNGHVLQRFHLERAIAQKTQFKLFGVEFSVDGFWAWDVWIAACASGILYLWLVRRGTFMRCEGVSFTQDVPSTDAAPRSTSAWPLWLRPLPPGKVWANTANSKHVDLVLDPLGAVCLVTMWVCATLSIVVAVRIAMVSSFLISESADLNSLFALHAGVCCLAAGITLGALLDWYVPRGKKRDSAGEVQRIYAGPVISRRACLLSGTGALVTALFYLPQLRASVFASVLKRHSREPMQPRGPRKRRRKLEDSSLQAGFYLSRSSIIYYMPPGRRSRAMAGLSESDLTEWNGPFDLETVRAVHPSALVPFVRAAVVRLIPSRRELRNPKMRKQLFGKPSVQEGYRKAFEITLAAIHRDDRRRGRSGRIPNLQLYDLLGALAQSCGSHALIVKAREELSKAAIRPLAEGRSREVRGTAEHSQNSAPKSSSAEGAANKTIHSRHSGRKKRATFLCRRQARVAGFRLQRLGDESPAVRRPQGKISAPPPHEPYNPPNRGTWDAKLSSTQELQSSVHVVRQRKHARKGRQRRRKGLDSC
jgi:hypothetical protein